jgi:Outer membrane protein beta-barrel domain
MKKTIVLISAFLLAAVVSHAQTEKGTQTLGLNLEFGYQKTSGVNINPYDNSSTDASSKNTSFNIGPAYSYFIADKLDLGASLSYGQSNYTYPQITNNIEKQTSYAFSGSLYLRKYIMFGGKLGLRAGPYLTYEKGDNKTDYSGTAALYNQDSKLTEYGAGARLELVYYPSKKLGFAASIANVSYDHNKFDNGNQGHSSNDNINASFISNNLGFSVFYVL